MKRYVCRLVWLVVGMVMASAVQAQSSRIAFVSDRDDTDLNNWVMREDGTYPTQITSESANVHRPSISPSGTRVVYEANGDLFMANTNGSGTPVTLANSPSGETYADPDAGPLMGFGSAGDFLVLFSRYYQYGSNPPLFAQEIWMGRVDVSEGTFVDWVLLTPGMTPTDGGQIQPAWCGSGHIVWSRQGTAVPYDPEICVLEVDEDGPIGDPACYWGGDEKDDAHPSCNASGTRIAWAREDATYTSHDIWVMDCEGTDCDTENAELLTDDGTHDYDNTRPVWAPSGTQIAFASNRPVPGSSESADDYEIWVMNPDGSGKAHRTDNSDADDDPDWGGATLP